MKKTFSLFSFFFFLLIFPFHSFAQSLPLPYYTGFDDALEKAGWQQFRLGIQSINEWKYGTSDYCSSPTTLYHGYNTSAGNTDTVQDWFVSPPLNISSPAILTFKISPTFYGTKLSIMFGTGSNNPMTGNFTEIANDKVQLRKTYVNCA